MLQFDVPLTQDPSNESAPIELVYAVCSRNVVPIFNRQDARWDVACMNLKVYVDVADHFARGEPDAIRDSAASARVAAVKHLPKVMAPI